MPGPHFSMKELIETKRDGGALAPDALNWIISEYTADRIPDYQMAAFVMAVYFRGMTGDELASWTEAMLHSGAVLEFADVPLPKVDKHSTGGVGDKVSIPLAPIVAACGLAVPMMSGRGLGHTGGTLDKLESIPGFRTALDPVDFTTTLEREGLVLAGQSETLVPADRRIYALRDATGTVPSIPLIASSIMSKKLAEGLDGLVLDVKVGSGAFMKDEARATDLARTMVDLGRAHGTTTVALLTNMDRPLGREVGNASEIRESIEVLRGEGPQDLTEVTYRLGEEMLVLGSVTRDRAHARSLLEDAVSSGAAMQRFQRVVAAQGGDPAVVDDPSLLPTARARHEMRAPRTGWIAGCDALDVGVASVRLGGGRQRKEDAIDPAVGITILKKPGDAVEAGEPLGTVSYNDDGRLAAALPLLERAWSITDERPEPGPLIIGEVR